MCFKIHPDHQDVKVTTSDIKCYKVLTQNNRSPYFRWLYKENGVARSGLAKIYHHLDTLGQVDVGLHTYSSKVKALRHADQLSRGNWLGESLKVVEMFIPAGAKYYYNPCLKEYVSDHLFTGNLRPIS